MDKVGTSLDAVERRFSRYIATDAESKLAYYSEGSLTLARLVFFETFIILCLTGFLAWLVTGDNSHDHYYAQTEGAWRVLPYEEWKPAVTTVASDVSRLRLMQDVGVPNTGRETISVWAAQIAAQVMTFGFNDSSARFELSRQSFTDAGWERFRKAMINSKLVDDMVKTQQLLTSVPSGVPVLRQEGMVEGVYSWTFEIPLLMTFRAGSDVKTTYKKVRMVIQRVDTRDNPKGVGISEWYLF